MTTLTYNGLIDDVLRLMDENGGNAQFMSGNATSEMREIIGRVSEDAVRKIHLQAPVAMLDGVNARMDAFEWCQLNDRWYYKSLLPDDFFRLIRCKVRSWKSSVSHLWWEDSAEYAKQGNKYLMGTEDKPRGFLVHYNSLVYVELYSCKDASSLQNFVYLPTPKWENGSIEVCDRVKDSSLCQVAADALAVLGEAERAQQMQQMAERALATYGGIERHMPDNGNRIER